MRLMVRRIGHFLAGENGTTAVEYAVMLAFIVTTILAVVTSIGSTSSGDFSTVNSAVHLGGFLNAGPLRGSPPGVLHRPLRGGGRSPRRTAIYS